jgi:hypothetical protein
MNHESKTADILFFVCQNVSPAHTANTVNMKAPPLLRIENSELLPNITHIYFLDSLG